MLDLCYLACVGCLAHHIVVFVVVSLYSTIIGYYLSLVESKRLTTLWVSDMPCAYKKPRKCEYLRNVT